jgi:hypothetical protein
MSKRERERTILLKCEWYETKVLFIVTLYTLQQMLQKTWALFACKGTKSEWKSCYDLSQSLCTSNSEQSLCTLCSIFFFLSLPQKRILTLALSPQKKEKEAPLVAHPLAGWNFYSWKCMLLGTFWEPDGNLGNVKGGGGNTLRREKTGPSWGHEEPSQWPHENIGPKNLQSPFSTKGECECIFMWWVFEFSPKRWALPYLYQKVS